MDVQDTFDPRLAPRVLLVLGEQEEGRRLAAYLSGQGFETIPVRDDSSGYNLLDTEQIDALVAEVRSPRIDGLRLLRVARIRNPEVTVVLVAGPNDVPLATRAMQEGAHDFQTRPLNHEKLHAVLQRGLAVQRMVGEMHELARRLDKKYGVRNLIGVSPAIAKVYNRILQVGGTDATVLVLGEAGTGRALVASTIHHSGSRRSSPLVRFDCAGMDTLAVEREVFGEERAQGGRPFPGRLELADGGTLVIDALEELPAAAQNRLLRYLKDGEFERLGSERMHRTDARIIGIATLRIRDRVVEGRFRPDLFDLLRAVTIEMPALRHRRRDIPLLAHHFLGEAVEETGKTVAGIRPAAMERLVRHSWPGNVAELKSVIRAMVELSQGSGPLDVGDLPVETREGIDDPASILRIPVGTSIAEAERQLIEATLEHCEQDRGRAARMLGIGLRTLQRRLADYGRARSRRR